MPKKEHVMLSAQLFPLCYSSPCWAWTVVHPWQLKLMQAIYCILQVWLQEFAWSEVNKREHKAARDMSSGPGGHQQDNQRLQAELQAEPMFCFETAMNMLYWSALVYDCDEVRVCAVFSGMCKLHFSSCMTAFIMPVLIYHAVSATAASVGQQHIAAAGMPCALPCSYSSGLNTFLGSS